jgi:hypothetical protein
MPTTWSSSSTIGTALTRWVDMMSASSPTGVFSGAVITSVVITSLTRHCCTVRAPPIDLVGPVAEVRAGVRRAF